MRLERNYVEKPWGRTELPPIFDAPKGKRIGEVWFTGGDNQQLLVKYIFTSERLSIQVHPNNRQANERGFPRGKTECWYIVQADEGATLGLGLSRSVSKDELRSSALDGSIEQLIDWRPVRKGDFFLVPPGTIHAIGSGISLLEFQQNSDITYRLYDYGRLRELHLEDGLEVARREPYPNALAQHLSDGPERVLVDGPEFILIETNRNALNDRERFVIPLEGIVRDREQIARPGECLLVAAGEDVMIEGKALVGANP